MDSIALHLIEMGIFAFFVISKAIGSLDMAGDSIGLGLLPLVDRCRPERPKSSGFDCIVVGMAFMGKEVGVWTPGE